MNLIRWGWGLVSGLSLQTYLIIAAVVAFAVWSGYCYSVGYSNADAMWRAKNLEATIEKLKADLAANELITKEAEADADKAEAEAAKLKELLDALSKKPPSCPLTGGDVDGVSKIDGSP